jgi:signal transduction histidine kinase
MLAHKLLPLVALGLNLLLLGSALVPERKSQRNLLFAYLAAALAVWNLGVFGLRAASTLESALLWERWLHVGVIPIPALFYHYVLAFLDVPRRRRGLILGYGLCAFFLAAGSTPAFIADVTESEWGYMPAAGLLYAPFFLYFQSYLIVGLVMLVRAYGVQPSSFKRNRTLLVILGVGVSLAGGVVDIARFLLHWDWLYPIGIPSNAIFALALGVAIVRYRLMDIGALAKRMVLYVMTSVALAPILFVGLWVIDQAVGARPGTAAVGQMEPFVRDALLLLLVFTIALPLLRKLEGGLEQLMFRRRHAVRDALVDLTGELGALLEVDTLSRKLTDGLVARIPVIYAGLHLYDPAVDQLVGHAHASSDADDSLPTTPIIGSALLLWLKMAGRTLIVEETAFQGAADTRVRAAVARLERQRLAVVVPLLADGELAGALVVGEKLSGEIFDTNEIRLLEMLAAQTVIALRNARLYEDLKARMDELRRTQQSLVQSAKLAAIGELAASVAHEINNPLTVIVGASQLLQYELPGDSPEHRRVSSIETEAHRAGKIVRDLLDFSRRREPTREPLALHEVLERAIDLLRPKLKTSGVGIERVFNVAMLPILGDRDQLTQVFVNVIANAIDAMDADGSLTVETGLQQSDDGRRMVGVSFTDTGHGISPEQIERIFEPFYTTKAEGRGTGLGLSVSLGIVRAHGGTIDIDSKPGLGTTVRIRLPLD